MQPSTINAATSSPDRSFDNSSPSAVSVIAMNFHETADLLVAEAISATYWPMGSRPTG
jgi:hypothetical protein